MSHSEKEMTIARVVAHVNGAIPVIAGAGANDTQDAIEACKTAQKQGADALLVVTPYYNKCTQNGLLAHYGAIAKATSLPIICYNVPSRTGVNLIPSTFAELSKNNSIVAIKEASGSMVQIEECLRFSNGNADVICGDDALTIPVMAMGGIGVISVASNVCPRYVSDMTTSALKGDWQTARKMQLDLLPLISALFSEVNPIPIKKAMQIKGFCNGKLRLPLTELSEENAKRLARELEKFC